MVRQTRSKAKTVATATLMETDDYESESCSAQASTITSNLLNDCKKYFEATDFYVILGLPKTATLTEIKKAYHKLALKVHPDKVNEASHKDDCKIKFQLLGKIYSILSNEEKRKLYDETGIIDGENDFSNENQDWESYWRVLFKKITEEDINGFFKTYQNSQEEREQLLSLYIKYKGNMDKIFEEMVSSSVLDDEERFREIIQQAIDDNQVESFKLFSNETKAKREKRRRKYEQEADEAEELKKQLKAEGDLAKMIAQKQEQRQQHANAFLQGLENKYAKKKK